MIINIQRYAASYVTVGGDVRRFYGIGGMLLHDHKLQEGVCVYWVHDHNSDEWIKTRESTLVLTSDLITPMSWGLATFSDRADAETYVTKNGGTTATFTEIQELIRSSELDPSKCPPLTMNMTRVTRWAKWNNRRRTVYHLWQRNFTHLDMICQYSDY